MTLNTVFAVTATIISIISFIPYLRDLRAHKIKPHLFSWVVWSLMTLIYFFAQVSGGAGIGALTTAITGIMTIYIAIVAFRHSDKIIKRVDWISLAISLIALVSWVATNNPVFAVILISISDFAGFLPTVRKSYADPYSETLSLYFMAGIKHILVIFSLQQITLTTSFYTFVLIIENCLFVLMLLYRRNKLKHRN
jgi:hypothetical protein